MREQIVYLVFFGALAVLGCFVYFGIRENPDSTQTHSAQVPSAQKFVADDSFVLTELNGLNLSDYSVLWWTWLYSIPTNKVSPVMDPDGKSCDYNQSGDVWFLAGTPGDDQHYVRDCIVPKGKYLFFPVITFISTRKVMCPDAILKAEIEPAQIGNIKVTLDDNILPDPLKFRAKSPSCFRLKGYIDGYSGLGRYPVASDGYWILMKPLDSGTHVLSIQAEYFLTGKDKGEEPDFIQDVLYRLTVK